MVDAIFTLLYNPSYLAGALVLAVQLRKILELSGVEAEIGVLIDQSQFTTSQLQLVSRYYGKLIDVSPIRSTLILKLTQDLQRPDLDKTFTKIELWSLVQYDKILYMDADTLPLLPEPWQEKDKDVVPTVAHLLNLEFKSNKILAAPDSGFPDVFNSGVFVLQPNIEVYHDLKSLVRRSIEDSSISFDGADQGLLNQYFNRQPDWVSELLGEESKDVDDFSGSNNWIKLPFLYNVTPSVAYEYLPAFKHFRGVNPGPEWEELQPEQPGPDQYRQPELDTLSRYRATALTYIKGQSQIKVVHFIGPYKPWTCMPTGEGMHGDWWRAWVQEFGERSVSDVVANKEEVNEQGEPVFIEEHQQIREEPQAPAIVVEPSPSDPFALSDPSRYQVFKNNIKPSVDAMWDPAREPPPKHDEPSDTSFSEDFGRTSFALSTIEERAEEQEQGFHGRGGPEQFQPPPEEEQFIYQPEAQQIVDVIENVEDAEYGETEAYAGDAENQPFEAPPPAPAPAPASAPASAPAPVFVMPRELPELYGHRFVEPERVFDESSDYFPNHILQDLEKIDIERNDNPMVPDAQEDPQAVSHYAADVESFNQEEEVLEKEAVIDENEFQEAIDTDNEDVDEEQQQQQTEASTEQFEIVDQAPKLFPWEFRGNQKPERKFN
ncbi:uncharacterized protein LODBEIA_P29990 [Lodderomyces beijingensis]|uniref:Glycosyltransferase family 8 protein n=1 Tax=Lodderomyces beijingensis TaxID=1775926 RepID=A0ABP0ZRE6_9ASCO